MKSWKPDKSWRANWWRWLFLPLAVVMALFWDAIESFPVPLGLTIGAVIGLAAGYGVAQLFDWMH